MADVIRRAGRRFIDRYQEFLTWPQVKVLKAIERCRTAALGGHRDQCDRCGHQAISYNSCRNRHCPKCQTNARDKWLAARQQELLSVDYYHLVFSVPHALVPLMWQNKKLLFKLLFEASAETLLEVAADPKHLGAQIGFLSVLHTWGQTLQPHPHVHCVVPGGGLSPDHLRWIRSPNHFFLPVKVLSRVFRGKFVAGLRRAFRHNKLVFFGASRSLSQQKVFSAFLRTLFRQDWVVYAKRPFGGPEHVLHYLARYTHRVAISNHRLVELTDTNVTFRWKDYAHHSKRRTMTLTLEEFLHRFLQHVLPRGFPRIRYFGFLANRRRGTLIPLCRTLLAVEPPPVPATPAATPILWLCPCCQGPMHVIERLTANQLREERQSVEHLDSS
ncbi:MAG: IS91 family transposase [bacterium]|nr:IS91 family transposase [bacterium]